MTRSDLENWIGRYLELWRTPGTESLPELFTPDATYLTAPFREKLKGHAAIAEMWEAEREGPDENFTFEHEIVAVEGDVGVAAAHVVYGEPNNDEYRDIWIVHLNEAGLCTAFEEWPFAPQ